MTFVTDKEELKPGLIIFRRSDVKHRNWYCRVKLPKADRYKTVSLKTQDINTARELAFDAFADVKFRLTHNVPVFNRPFSQVAAEYVELQKKRANAGRITMARVKKIESVINAHLIPYVGSTQIHLIGAERWAEYPFWRRAHGEGRAIGTAPPKDRPKKPVSDATIRFEMSIFRAIMNYAASRKYIADARIFGGKLELAKVRREAFNPKEYRDLHTIARSWVKQAKRDNIDWYRNVAYLFILIMCNTGMRPPEAKNLRWRDVVVQTRDGRKLLVLQVRGKKKNRSLVAAANVAEYFERLRAIAKATEPDDAVFTTFEGEPSRTLYGNMIGTLLKKANLQIGPEGTLRSVYSFRHTYATFRLSEGVDVYLLAHQMGTSVKMIEDHYGHVSSIKNAGLILKGMPGWEAAAESLPQTGEAAAETTEPQERSTERKAAPRREKPSDPKKPGKTVNRVARRRGVDPG